MYCDETGGCYCEVMDIDDGEAALISGGPHIDEAVKHKDKKLKIDNVIDLCVSPSSEPVFVKQEFGGNGKIKTGLSAALSTRNDEEIARRLQEECDRPPPTPEATRKLCAELQMQMRQESRGDVATRRTLPHEMVEEEDARLARQFQEEEDSKAGHGEWDGMARQLQEDEDLATAIQVRRSPELMSKLFSPHHLLCYVLSIDYQIDHLTQNPGTQPAKNTKQIRSVGRHRSVYNSRAALTQCTSLSPPAPD